MRNRFRNDILRYEWQGRTNVAEVGKHLSTLKMIIVNENGYWMSLSVNFTKAPTPLGIRLRALCHDM